jgi:hypothetical protein
MARIEIPALYRLDIGGSTWGWHKLEDVVAAVNNLLERSAAVLVRNHTYPMTAQEIVGQLGKSQQRLLIWTDETDIDTVDDHDAKSLQDFPWDKPNLFVPAGWGMKAITHFKQLAETK